MAKYTDANIDNFASMKIKQCGTLEVDENGNAVITNGKRRIVHHCYAVEFYDHQGDGVYGATKFMQSHDSTEAEKITAARTAIKTLEIQEPPIENGPDFTNEVINVDLS